MATLRVTPDTGATVDVIKEDIAKQIGADIEPNTGGYKLSDAQNANLKIVGTCKLRLQCPGGQWLQLKQWSHLNYLTHYYSLGQLKNSLEYYPKAGPMNFL